MVKAFNKNAYLKDKVRIDTDDSVKRMCFHEVNLETEIL